MTLWKKGKKENSKKTLVHSYRQVIFALQLYETECKKASNLEEGNEFYREMMKIERNEWKEIKNFYDKNFEKKMEEFTDKVNAYKQFTFDENVKKIKTIQYIEKKHFSEKKNFAEIIFKQLSIETCFEKIDENTELVYLNRHSLHSPNRSDIVKECRGLVIEKKNQNFNVVCLPLINFSNFDEDLFSEEKFVPELDWESVKIYPKKNFVTINLFFYHNDWLISSHVGHNFLSQSLCENNNFDFPFFHQFVGPLFKKIWNEKQMKFPEKNEQKKFVYIFSFHPFLKIIRLVAIRNMSTLNEEDHVQHAEQHGWEYSNDLRSQLDLLDSNKSSILEKLKLLVNQSDVLIDEGFVLCDKNFTRIKVK